MHCVDHSDRAASAICQRCDKSLCNDCTKEHGGRKFCDECARFVSQRETRRPPPSSASAASANAASAAPASAAADTYPGSTAEPPLADVYQGPSAEDIYPGPPPTDVPRSPAPTAVYQGPTPGAAHPGSQPDDGTPPADVYQGPPADGPPAGDVYAPPPVAGSPTAAAAAASAEGSFSIRGLLAGIFGVFIAAGLYYWLAVGFDLRTKFFVFVMAFVVAITARLGAGRAGGDIGLAAAALFLVSVVLGNYLVEQKYHEEAYTATQIQRQAAAEISIDGDYTDNEAQRLLGFLPAEWDALPPDERQAYREELHDDYEMAIYEGWDPKEFYAVDEEEAALEPSLAFGTYFDNLILYLGFSGLFFIGLGCWQAYKIASTET